MILLNKAEEYFIVFSFGSILYGLVEVIFRGHTHWTMLLLGGIAVCVLYFLNMILKKLNIFFRCLVGSAVISLMEFLCGYFVNIRLHMKVWDYSGIRFNILGQICPKYILAWFLLCVPAYFLSDLIRKKAIKR